MVRFLVALLVVFTLSAVAAPAASAAPPSPAEESAGSGGKKAVPDIPVPTAPPAAPPAQPTHVPRPPAPVPSRSPSAAPEVSPPSTKAGAPAGVVEHPSGSAQPQRQEGRATSYQGSSPASTPSRASRGTASTRAQGTGLTGARGSASGGEDSGAPAAGRLSPRPVTRKRTEVPHFNTPIPRWLARVWPAIALAWGWRPTAPTAIWRPLVPFVGPGAGLALPTLPAALAASKELTSQEGASRSSPAEATAPGSQPKRFPLQQISDLDPGALKMLLLALAFVGLSYIAVRYQGGGGERPHRHG
jgi:hypothetical protein